MLGAIFRALGQAFQRVVRGRKPSQTVKPSKIQGNKDQPTNQTPKKRKTSQESSGQDDRFWRDKVESDATVPKQKFYVKHRNRLENQDPDISRDR
ncbi:MAG: hypothetical protein AB8B50_04010 [Pirellulaceae bacterium]